MIKTTMDICEAGVWRPFLVYFDSLASGPQILDERTRSIFHSFDHRRITTETTGHETRVVEFKGSQIIYSIKTPKDI